MQAATLGTHGCADPARVPSYTMTLESLVAIGSSAGGTDALARVLPLLPPDAPAILIVQHMPERYSSAFAARLDRACRIEVKVAARSDPVIPGRALIAPGNRHMVLCRDGDRYHVDVFAGPRANRHRPSVDVLFASVARHAGANALGIIMTGMGSDGAAGLLAMRKAGARTLAQDEQSCVVYGMPRQAIKRGAAQAIVPLTQLAATIVSFARG